jgi:DNA polymerase II small subunit
VDREILNLIRERGLLLEREVFDFLEGFGSVKIARNFLEQIERISGERMITRKVLKKNVEYVRSFVSNLPGEEKSTVERVIVNLGFSLEVKREQVEGDSELESGLTNFGRGHSSIDKNANFGTILPPGQLGSANIEKAPLARQDYKVFYANTSPDKKLEVKDFSGHFKARYGELQRILMERRELQKNLVSINKIGNDRQNISIIGIVKDKRVTKNKNLFITFEDLTGEIKVLVKWDKGEIFDVAEELQLDDVVGVRASGNRDVLFANEIFFPDAFIIEKKKFESEIYVAFVSDTHCGSDRHLGENFKKYLDWLNSEDEIAKKIKYLFFVGDNVDGVGIFPGQESVLDLKSMREQYSQLAGYLRRVPKRITMFMCPGQHDATRVAEPQPLINKKYAPELYEIENLVLVTNPTMVKLIEGEIEFKILMYHGASIHSFINEIKELRMMKAHQCPAKAVRHMLKRRHLAPTHGEVVYIPNMEKDPMVISEIPDVLCTGEVHRPDIESYNGVLIITGSCWQSQTPFEEKVGNIPDPCKVPVLNLKSRELKVFDFSGEGDK